MSYQITHIRLSSTGYSNEHITHVKLSSGVQETVQQVVSYIDAKFEYYYTSANGSKAIVETVHPVGKAAYIRTKANNTTQDNLLSLPRF